MYLHFNTVLHKIKIDYEQEKKQFFDHKKCSIKIIILITLFLFDKNNIPN